MHNGHYGHCFLVCYWKRRGHPSNRRIWAFAGQKGFVTLSIECFHMTSRRPYWCPKTMKRRPCWCPKPVLWELNSFLMQTLSFVPINLHRCWPREWKHSIGPQLGDQTYDLPALLYDALPTEVTPQWLTLDNDEPNYFTKLLIFKLYSRRLWMLTPPPKDAYLVL